MLFPAATDIFGGSRHKTRKIVATAEFQRIVALPWLDWRTHVEHNQGYLRLSTALKTPQGEQWLWPIQAAALTYLHDYGGLFGPIPVGRGKTIVTFLAPRIVGAERPALFIPASLREKTWREFQKLYRHWFGPTVFLRRKSFDYVVFNYEELSREGGQKRLFEYKPDLICADEVQMLKNRDAACTKTVQDFMVQHYTTKFAALTGTPTSRNPMEFWHIAFWCLRERLPLPRVHSEAMLWADAIKESKDISVNRPDAELLLQYFWREGDEKRIPSGVSMFDEMEYDTHRARIAFGNRLASCPGVVVDEGDEDEVGASIQVRELRWHPGINSQMWLSQLRDDNLTPNGVEVQLPMEKWRIARELVCGFYYYWDPPPPVWWLEARRTLGWYFRNILLREGVLYEKYLPLSLRSPSQIANAIVQGRITEAALCKAYARWIEVKPHYVYTRHAVWVDDSFINQAAAWASKHRGVIWTEHLAFGERLARTIGTGFCAEQGLDANGKLIDDYNGETVVASVGSNHKGRNLQAWNSTLAVTIPPNGAKGEQLIGRFHRKGQQADTVYFDWVNGCPEQEDGFAQLLADARYIESSTKQRQKFNYADYV